MSRTVAMIDKYFEGAVPAERQAGEYDEELKKAVTETPLKVEELMDKLQFSSALTEIWKVVSRTNKYIDETMPWKLAKDEDSRARLAAVMYNLAESIRIISILIQPFMVETPLKIWEQLGIEEGGLTSWESAKTWGAYPAENAVKKGEIIFPRIDLKKEMEELEKLGTGQDKNDTGSKESGDKGGNKDKDKNAQSKAPAANKADETSQAGYVTIEDFAKLDLRVAKVLQCEKVEGADKLLKFKLELGDEIRQVISGIAKTYDPKDLIGKNVVMIANLKPVKLRGIESQGMILTAEDADGLALLTTVRPAASGAKIS